MNEPGNGADGWRPRLQALVEATSFQRTIIALILVNAVVLGLETSPSVMAQVGTWLIAVDRIILAVFVVEIAMRLGAYGARRFFRDPWSVFDFLVVAVALVPASETFSVIRALRVLRILRLISAVPRMRAVVEGLLRAIPGLASIVALLAILFYVAAVMATNLFGKDFPDWFGTIGASLYSLFQVMTLESWSMGIARPVMEVYPYAWAFFVPFILVATFTVLNLFIAVVVNAMQGAQHEAEAHTDAVITAATHEEAERLRGEIGRLREDIAALRQEILRLASSGPAALPVREPNPVSG
jgi:voltage-gated sodium channel